MPDKSPKRYGTSRGVPITEELIAKVILISVLEAIGAIDNIGSKFAPCLGSGKLGHPIIDLHQDRVRDHEVFGGLLY